MVKQKIKPLSEAERLDWNSHKIIWDQFAEGSKLVIHSLADTKKRELYREEYGPGKEGWEKFKRESPWFGKDRSRQRRSQFYQAAEIVEEMSTRVDATLLEDMSEMDARRLRSVVQNPNSRAEVYKLLKEEGKTFTDDNIEKALTRINQAHEDEDRQRKAECGMELKIAAPDDSEEEEEETPAEVPSATAAALKETERRTAKQSDHAGRFVDHGRLAVKNGDRIALEDLDDAALRARVEQTVERLEETTTRLRGLLEESERRSASAG